MLWRAHRCVLFGPCHVLKYIISFNANVWGEKKKKNTVDFPFKKKKKFPDFWLLLKSGRFGNTGPALGVVTIFWVSASSDSGLGAPVPIALTRRASGFKLLGGRAKPC